MQSENLIERNANCSDIKYTNADEAITHRDIVIVSSHRRLIH